MQINLSGAGKRYNREWIFRQADLAFTSGSSYAITGPNGSGKSTFLQCLGSLLLLSSGKVSYSSGTNTIAAEDIYRYLSFCAPYLDLPEEMTLQEFLRFHQAFKPFIQNMEISAVAEKVGLGNAFQKQIRFFSSGMKQRVKLAQAILSDTDILLLDEPCSNLDKAGIELYQSLIESYGTERLVVVSSNDEAEYRFCRNVISILDYKPALQATS
jgi:ABC-type multidrug transport system ATPase subunit